MSVITIEDTCVCHDTHPFFDLNVATYGYQLDNFQKFAILAIDKGNHVLVTAKTGCGKTKVAEYAIYQAVKKGKKVIFASPIKTLSNQKYYDFKKHPILSEFNYGIMTGDIKLNPNADCVIMTTEILRKMLENGNTHDTDTINIKDVDCIIFDEVHYIKEKRRGSVWEESILRMPYQIKMVMLSATIGQPELFADWITKKGTDVTLITATHRVVPLTTYAYYYLPQSLKKDITLEQEKMILPYKNKLVELYSGEGKFNSDNYTALQKIQNNLTSGKRLIGKEYLSTIGVYNQTIKFLHQEKLTPAIFFVMSKKKCNFLAKKIDQVLNEGEEMIKVKKMVENHLHKLENPQDYIDNQEYRDLINMLQRGIGVHHAGMLPIFKEIVEILYSQNLIKVLFATETFAVGLNMPTKTVLFTSLTKPSESGFRYFTTSEFQQMSGRAGRRGIDPVGRVIILPNLVELPYPAEFKHIAQGKIDGIYSQFQINFKYILTCLLNEEEDTAIIDKSLLQRDIQHQIKVIRDEISKEKIESQSKIKSDILPILAEYDKILHPPTQEMNFGFKIKKSQKQIKKEKKRKMEIMNQLHKISDWKIQYSLYKKIQDQKSEQEKRKQELICLQKYIPSQIDKVIQILIKLQYLKNIQPPTKSSLTTRGITALEITECDEIILTEIIENKVMENLTISELCIFLSIFGDSHIPESESTTPLTKKSISSQMISAIQKTQSIVENVQQIIKKYDTYLELETSKFTINLDLLEITSDWVSPKVIRGETESLVSTSEIMTECKSIGILPGSFIRDMNRIYKISESLIKIYTRLENLVMVAKLQEIAPLLIREVINSDSLYLQLGNTLSLEDKK